VVTFLAYGCPIQAMVQAFGWDERTVARWRDRAGEHGTQVQEAIVRQGTLDLVPVQADEIRGKGRQLVAWMGLAMMGSTRLWLAGVGSQRRENQLADRLLRHVRACRHPWRTLLVCTDGWHRLQAVFVGRFASKGKRRRDLGERAWWHGRIS
jgi:hypothetical protein